jgi:hypothetical protein
LKSHGSTMPTASATTSKRRSHPSTTRPLHDETSTLSTLTCSSRATTAEPIKQLILSKKRQVPYVEIPRLPWKKRKLESVEIDEPQSEERYGGKKPTKFGKVHPEDDRRSSPHLLKWPSPEQSKPNKVKELLDAGDKNQASSTEEHDAARMGLTWVRDIFDLSDDELATSAYSDDSPPPMNFKIGPPRGVKRSENVKTKKKTKQFLQVSAPFKSTSTSADAARDVYDVMPQVAMEASKSHSDSQGSQTMSPRQSAKFEFESRVSTFSSPLSSPPSSDDDIPLIRQCKLRAQTSAPMLSLTPSADDNVPLIHDFKLEASTSASPLRSTPSSGDDIPLVHKSKLGTSTSASPSASPLRSPSSSDDDVPPVPKSKLRPSTSSSPLSSPPSSDDVPRVQKSELRASRSPSPLCSPPSSDDDISVVHDSKLRLSTPTSSLSSSPSSDDDVHQSNLRTSRSPSSDDGISVVHESKLRVSTSTSSLSSSPSPNEDVSLCLNSFQDSEYNDGDGRLGDSIGHTNHQAPSLEALYLRSSNELPMPQHTNPPDNPEILAGFTPARAADDESMVPEAGTQGSITSPFRLRPASFVSLSLSPRSANDVLSTEGMDEETDERSSCTEAMLVQEMEKSYVDLSGGEGIDCEAQIDMTEGIREEEDGSREPLTRSTQLSQDAEALKRHLQVFQDCDSADHGPRQAVSISRGGEQVCLKACRDVFADSYLILYVSEEGIA